MEIDQVFPQFGKLYFDPSISAVSFEVVNVPKLISDGEMVNFRNNISLIGLHNTINFFEDIHNYDNP